MQHLKRMLIWYLDLGYRVGLTITRRTAYFKIEREKDYQDFSARTIMVVFTFPLSFFIFGLLLDQLHRQFDRSEQKFLIGGIFLLYGWVVMALYKRSGYRSRIRSYRVIPYYAAVCITAISVLSGVAIVLAGAQLSKFLHQLIFR